MNKREEHKRERETHAFDERERIMRERRTRCCEPVTKG
jgi:hypothetical protein